MINLPSWLLLPDFFEWPVSPPQTLLQLDEASAQPVIVHACTFCNDLNSQYTHTHTRSNTIVSITYLSGLQYLPANVGFSWWMGGWSREMSCRQKTRKIMQMKSRRVLLIQSFLPALSYQWLSDKDLKFWNERISLSDPTIRQDTRNH